MCAGKKNQNGKIYKADDKGWQVKQPARHSANGMRREKRPL
jgi:hypothetical protein